MEVVAYSFRDLILYHHSGEQGGEEYGSVQTAMLLEKELRFYILIQREQEVDWLTGHDLSIYETSKPASTVKHFLQQGHT